MDVQTDKSAAVEFLEWWFGKDPAPYSIGMSYQRDLDSSALDDSASDDDEDDEPQRRKAKRAVQQFAYAEIRKAVMSQWDGEADRNHVYFCTTPLLTKQPKLDAFNAAGVPGLWVDIDAMRDLDLDGNEFFVEIRDQETASCWTRSSEQGIQGFFKLDQFFSLATTDAYDEDTDEETQVKAQRSAKRKLFQDELKPLLLHMAYYFGGDTKVVSPARLMRLPGSVNPKRDNYLCKATYYDHAFAMAELRKRFKQDENLVPKVVFYAIAKAMEKVYGPGSHHDPSVKLFGTCRMMGLDENSCERLSAELFKFFKAMGDDPTPSVATTYDRSMDDGLATLRNDYEQIAEEVEKIVKWWVTLKVQYCKAIGLHWKPEIEGNPLSPPGEQDGIFTVKQDGTYFVNKSDVPEQFANFSIKILHKVIKVDGKEVDVAELTFRDRLYKFEWTSEKDTTFTKFKTIAGLPPKLMVLKEDMWKPYVAWLGSQPVEKFLQESSYYGMLDVEEGKPTLLLPKQDHPSYIWADSVYDTADHTHAFKHVSKKTATDYLTNLAEYYPNYHEPKFIWSALGWFVACPFAAFARAVYKGFPVLMVSGLGESGKTHLIKYVLASHMGCEDAQMYLGTTQYVRRKQLASNNLMPLIVDEFRDVDELKTTQFLDLIRNLWDQGVRKAGTADGGVSVDHLVGTMAVVGEHQYQDEATLHRTFSIRVDRTFIESTFEYTTKQQERMVEGREWLESSKHKGVLGSIIYQWMQENMDKVPKLMLLSKKMIDDGHKTHKLRNAIGLSIIVFGILVINEIFKQYEVDFPLPCEQMFDAIFSADQEVNTSAVYGAANLKTLFQVTDNVIIAELRRSQSFEHYVYEFDIEDENIVYFDMNRWHDAVHRLMRGSASATLMNKVAFIDLLHVSLKNPDSPILGFPDDHPVIRKGCIQLDMSKVRDQFNINVQQWKMPKEDY